MTEGGRPQAREGRRRQARPVMTEVADRAGVALSSVSRVLNGHPSVSTVLRNRVLDAVAALGYEPHLLAQSLRTGETMTIGFVVADISNPLISQIALGAELRLRQRGYSMILANSKNDASLEMHHLRLLRQRRVDGLLLSLSDETDPLLKAELDRLDMPCVLIDRQVAGLDLAAVLSDHAHGMRAAVTHLVALGHRRISLVTGAPTTRPFREQIRALRRECRATPGLSSVVRTGAFASDRHGYLSTLDVMRSGNRPTAVIAGSNQLLVGVLEALRELDLAIPDAVSLVACDAPSLATFLHPPTTTITRNLGELGRTAADLLLEQLEGGGPRTAALPMDFRPSASCAAPRERAPEAHP